MKNPYIEWLDGVLGHMLQNDLNTEERRFLRSVANELEQCAVADGKLTEEEINNVEKAYARFWA